MTTDRTALTTPTPSATLAPAAGNRLAALALSAVLTLGMLGGINTLATSDDGSAARLAQAGAPRA